MVAVVATVFDQAYEQEMKERLQRPPDEEVDEAAGNTYQPMRWTLRRIRKTFSWLTGYSLTGIWRLLKRWGIRLRRGRPQQYSPDTEYEQKEARLLDILTQVAANPESLVMLFSDEYTYYNWPFVGSNWNTAKAPSLQAKRCDPGQRQRRIVGGLDAMSGRVVYRQANKIDVKTFIAFLRQVNRAYSEAERIYIVVDNWPVHKANLVIDKLATDELARIELVYLPTYSPWLNPIEKLWGWLKQDILKLHDSAEAFDVLKERVTAFVDQFSEHSELLLQRVGLLGAGKLANARLAAFENQ